MWLRVAESSEEDEEGSSKDSEDYESSQSPPPNSDVQRKQLLAEDRRQRYNDAQSRKVNLLKDGINSKKSVSKGPKKKSPQKEKGNKGTSLKKEKMV